MRCVGQIGVCIGVVSWLFILSIYEGVVSTIEVSSVQVIYPVDFCASICSSLVVGVSFRSYSVVRSYSPIIQSNRLIVNRCICALSMQFRTNLVHVTCANPVHGV